MGKEHSGKKDKKEKKEKKEKRAEVDGVVKKSKKEKKEKRKSLTNGDVSEELQNQLASTKSAEVDGDGDVEMEAAITLVPAVQGALVPFSFPLADDSKEVKKILRTVKKSAKAKTLRRGVKEVVKALRKTEFSGPSSSNISDPPAVVIIAADISPMDVISHIPVLCEDHNIPYIYVKSRVELGESAATKRPTSVTMVCKEKTSKKAKDVKADDVEEFQQAFGDLVKLVVKASHSVKV